MKQIAQITLNDIPQEEKDKFINALAAKDQEYQRLLNKHVALRKLLRLAEAARVKKELEAHVERRLNEVLIHAKFQAVQMMELFKDMEESDIIEINTRVNSIILLADMIETFSCDINQIVKKYHPDCRVDMYDKFGELGREAPAK